MVFQLEKFNISFMHDIHTHDVIIIDPSDIEKPNVGTSPRHKGSRDRRDLSLRPRLKTIKIKTLSELIGGLRQNPQKKYIRME